MEFMELLKKRYSVRGYSSQNIENETLQKILEAGRLSPSAHNNQPQKIFVLKSPEALEKIRNVTRMAYNAPVVLLVCYDETLSWKNTKATFGEEYDGGEMDACIVTTMMMMQATELGVSSLWVRGYDSEKIVEVFQLPENIKPVCLLLLGYPDERHTPDKRRQKEKKPLSETVQEV